MIELASASNHVEEDEIESLVGNAESNRKSAAIAEAYADDEDSYNPLAFLNLKSRWAACAAVAGIALLLMISISGGKSQHAGSPGASSPDDGFRGEMLMSPGPDGLAKDGGPVIYQYRRRGLELTAEERTELAEEWGHWTFTDPKKDQRPKHDYCGEYPHRDIPWDNFPENSWQKDPEYLAEYLPQAKALVMRAMEAHLSEYGFGQGDLPGENFETRRDKSPFLLEFVTNEERRRKLSTGVNDYSGWTTPKSYDGLVRRLLHAIVSQDTFNLVLGGHSSAAGHGNHFQQSYALQFQKVMEPVFARLGVKHFSRNTGMGGLGTIQSAMGAMDIYGRDVDIGIWDSSMTERDPADFDLFARQMIMGSERAPLLMAGVDSHEIYPSLQEHADVDYIMYGTGKGPLPSITDPTKIEDMPWAVRYLKCEADWQNLCKENRYNGTCWIERPDHFEPPTEQRKEPGGRASWHEGNREHQLYGRTLSFTVLSALHSAIEKWEQQSAYKLPDDMWHVTDYYRNIRDKVVNLDPSIGACYDVEGRLSTEFCKIPFQARSEFSPRAYPAYTSLRSVMKPFGPDQRVPWPGENIYEPPDVYNPYLGVPKGEVDYLAIVENGNDYFPFVAPAPRLGDIGPSQNKLLALDVDDKGEKVVPGIGWGVNARVSADLCNGTYDSFCGRSEDHECLLYGHNDYRGGMTFDSLSGWGVFTLRNLKHGLIFFKMDSWRKSDHHPVTEGWTEENNGTDPTSDGGRKLRESLPRYYPSYNTGPLQEPKQERGGNYDGRRLKQKKEDAKFCKDFTLEFAVNGNVTRISTDEILGERHSLVQRVVQIWTVQNDPGLTSGEIMDVEVGVRLRGCQRQHVFWLTHIYWA